MKVKMYMDVYKGQRDFFAISNVSYDPCDGQKRFHFTVEIPDSAVTADQGQYTHVEDFKEVK